MKRFFTSAIICTGSLLLWNCKPDDDTPKYVERDRQEVYNENIGEIENFLKNNSLKINGDEITFEEKKDGSVSIWDQNIYPLQSIDLQNDSYSISNGKYEKSSDNISYKVYYLIINEGGGTSPFVYDNVFT